MKPSYRNRINRLTAQLPSDPMTIYADRPLSDDDAAGILCNWRSEVAAGRARHTGNALYVGEKREMTAEEWEAKYCREA